MVRQVRESLQDIEKRIDALEGLKTSDIYGIPDGVNPEHLQELIDFYQDRHQRLTGHHYQYNRRKDE